MKETLILDSGLQRNDFKIHCIKFVRNFLAQNKISIQENAFCMLVNEICKNIWDHASGKGEISLELKQFGLFFEIKDHGTGKYNLETVRKQGSSLKGNGINRGFGICGGMIQSTADILSVTDFKINTDCGFKYSGTTPLTQE